MGQEKSLHTENYSESEAKVSLNMEIPNNKGVICDMCGHVNAPNAAICEMCSNYLFLQGGKG